MAAPRKRLPKSFYFTSQYSSPFHRNEDRISQIDFRTFDPFVPEARQTVANCKKHRRQRHELSDKCKHVLAIVDAQERLLSTRPETQQLAGYSAQGAQMRKPEISIEFGDGIPEIAKEYVKFWIEQSGMVREPFSRQYDVHTLEDEHNHPEKPSIVLMAPFIEVDTIDENKISAVVKMFFQNPKEFAAKNKIGNLRIYSMNKKTHDEDALGYIKQLPIKIIGKEIITKNLQKAEPLTKPATEEEFQQWVEEEKKRFEAEYERVRNIAEEAHQHVLEMEKQIEDAQKKAEELKSEYESMKDSEMIDKERFQGLKNEYEDSVRNVSELNRKKDKWSKQYESYTRKQEDISGAALKHAEKYRPESASEKEYEELEQDISRQKNKFREMQEAREKRERDKKYNDKQKKILRDMLSPENNIAPNRLGEGTNPIGYAMQAAETPWRMAANILSGWTERKMAEKEKQEEDEYFKRLQEIEAGNRTLEEEKRKVKSAKIIPNIPKTKPKTSPGPTPEPTPQPEPQPTQTQTGSEANLRQEMVPSELEENTIQSRLARQKKEPFHTTATTVDEQKSEKYLNTSDLIIIAKLKRRGI